MSLHLVTGHAGYEHITPADHGAFHNALLLSGSYVLNIGNKFSASVISNNSIQISDGELFMQGRYIRMKSGEYEEVTIENGTQDSARNDLIVARYIKDETTGIESVSFVVIKGTPAVSNPSDPEYIEGDILNGALVADYPLYRVPLVGLNVGELVPLFDTIDSFDARIVEIIKGTKKVGNAKTLNGHEEGYFATQTSLEAVQSTSKSVVSKAGWYRVAEYGDNSDGYSANACELIIKSRHDNRKNEFHRIHFVAISSNMHELYSIEDKSTANAFTKVRYTRDSNTKRAYLEVYYNDSVAYNVSFTVNDGTDHYNKWKAIKAVATSETVDGVTVTTTADIRANVVQITTGNRLEFIGTVSGVENPLTFDKNTYKELYCEIAYFGSAKVTLDIIPNGGNYYSGLETDKGTLGGSVKVQDNTIKTMSFYYEDVSRTDDNVTLSVWGKR